MAGIVFCQMKSHELFPIHEIGNAKKGIMDQTKILTALLPLINRDHKYQCLNGRGNELQIEDNLFIITFSLPCSRSWSRPIWVWHSTSS